MALAQLLYPIQAQAANYICGQLKAEGRQNKTNKKNSRLVSDTS